MRLKKFLVNSLLTSSLILSTFAISHPITTTPTVHAEYSTKLTDNAELIFENDDKDSGKLYINGIFQKDFTGLAYDYYFEKGVRSKFEGLQKIGNDVFLLWMYRPLHIFSTHLIRYKLPSDTSAKLYYIGKNAKIDFTFTGLAYYHVPPHVSDQRITSEEWNKAFTASNEYRPQLFYVKNGIVDETANGWHNINGKPYLLKNGAVQNLTGLHNIHGTWALFKDGRLLSQSGLVQHQSNKRWFYVHLGEIDWKFTGIAQNPNNKRWFYVKNGEVDWTFTGIAKNPNNKRWFYVKNGEVNWKFTGIAQNPVNKRWFYVKNGEVNWKFTGIAQNPINKNWFYVKNGEVDWTFTGLVTHTNQKTYYIQKGFLKWGVNTTLKQNGKVYTIKNSTVVK